jgi:small subunit ribosomal protein S9
MIKQYQATGRRKTSVASVRMVAGGSGKITVNKKEFTSYFPIEFHQLEATKPLTVTGNENTFDIFVKVLGGGLTGQVDAVKLGIARALVLFDEELKPSLRSADLLTRDPRMVERKKYGFKKARKSFQFSKR